MRHTRAGGKASDEAMHHEHLPERPLFQISCACSGICVAGSLTMRYLANSFIRRS
jgi:hypothetical protein